MSPWRAALAQGRFLPKGRQWTHWRPGRNAWPALATLALVCAALGLHLLVLPQQTQQLQAQRQRSEALRQQVLAASSARAQAGALSSDPIEALRLSLPEARERQPRVAELLALATRHGLSVPRSEYRYSTEPALGVAGYRITVPLVGRYPVLRRFLEDALTQDPALVLDSLRLRRASPQVAELQAELKLTLWMRAEPGVANTASGQGKP